MGKFSRSAAPADGDARSCRYPSAGDDAVSYPVLVEFLSLELFEDGKPRQTGTVKLLQESGRLKAVVDDRQEGRVAFVCLESLETALRELEGLLEGDTLDWRKSKWEGRRR